MDENFNKSLRDIGHKCHYCCVYGVEDPSKTLKACAGCKAVYYCSRECQVNDWKSHKSACRRQVQRKVAISNALGASFTEYTEYWRNQHESMLSLVAKQTLLGNLRETHVLIIVSNYDPNAGRDKRACIQIESVSTESFASLVTKYGDEMRTAFTDIMKNSKPDPSNDYYDVLNYISNRENPAAPAMCTISCIGCPRDVPPVWTVDEVLAGINKGDYNMYR